MPEWIDVERLATRALFALGRDEEGAQRLFALLVLDPALTVAPDAPDAMKAALGPATRRLLSQGRVEVEHAPPSDLKQLRHQPLVFTLTDPLARVAQAEVLFEFVDATETKGFAQVPLTRRSRPDGRSTWTGQAPPMAWPPRYVRYRLVLESPARTAIEHPLVPITLKPSAALLKEEADQRAERVRISREAKRVVQEEEAKPFPVALAAASTFTALTFGAGVVTVMLFGAVVVGDALVANQGLGLTGEQRVMIAGISTLSSIGGLLGIPAVLLLGAVSAGVWTYYGFAQIDA